MTPQLQRGFEWQADYGVFSVSEQNAARVVEYIKNQKQHHAANAPVQEWETIGMTE